jgi:hypothetical protein
MSVPVRSLTFCRLAGAVTALWLSAADPTWAGDGGADLASLNNALGDLCTFFQSFVTLPSCPQAPTITQGVLQLAAWNVVPPETISATNSIPLGTRVNAGNPSIPPVGPTPPPIASFPVMGSALSNLLPNLMPLAFISSSSGPAKATQLYDPKADMFLYAVASGTQGQPDSLYLFYDDTTLAKGDQQGQIVAKFSLPLVVLNTNNTERLVPTTLQFRATSARDCSTSTVVGNFSGASSGTQTLMASQIGVNCAVVFAPSPLSASSHAIFEVAVPLVLTIATDPLYVPADVSPPVPSNPIGNVPSPFSTQGVIPPPLTPPPNLGPNGTAIGVGPAAVPLCTGLPCPPPTPPAPVSALCANLPRGGNGNANSNGQTPVPGVAAYYAISTAGETLLSAAVPSASTSVCPF